MKLTVVAFASLAPLINAQLDLLRPDSSGQATITPTVLLGLPSSVPGREIYASLITADASRTTLAIDCSIRDADNNNKLRPCSSMWNDFDDDESFHTTTGLSLILEPAAPGKPHTVVDFAEHTSKYRTPSSGVATAVAKAAFTNMYTLKTGSGGESDAVADCTVVAYGLEVTHYDAAGSQVSVHIERPTSEAFQWTGIEGSSAEVTITAGLENTPKGSLATTTTSTSTAGGAASMPQVTGAAALAGVGAAVLFAQL